MSLQKKRKKKNVGCEIGLVEMKMTNIKENRQIPVDFESEKCCSIF